jgi:four helix bundle protein
VPITNNKPYDLSERTLKFAKDIFTFVNICPKTMINSEVIKQLIRSSGSVGANYIEAQEALSKKDFSMRVKICRKEAKESQYWLKLLEIKDKAIETQRQSFISETMELLRIFTSIIEKVKVKNGNTLKRGGEV